MLDTLIKKLAIILVLCGGIACILYFTDLGNLLNGAVEETVEKFKDETKSKVEEKKKEIKEEVIKVENKIESNIEEIEDKIEQEKDKLENEIREKLRF